MNISEIDSIIFDVDGTLWDSRDAVARAWRDVILEETDWKVEFDSQTLGSLFGKTMDQIFFHFYPDKTMADYEWITPLIYKKQQEYLIQYAPSLYEGVKETLEELSKRYNLYIVTNAQKGYIETIFAIHDIKKYFKDWMCFGDTNAPKNITISKLMERNGLKAPIYVGDTKGDANACELVGIPIIYAAYGLGKIDAPWKSINNFSMLNSIFNV